MRYLVIVLAIANLGQAPAPSSGAVTGRVRYSQGMRALKTDTVHIYLEPIGTKPVQPGRGVEAAIVQKDERFTPNVLVVPAGATVFFPNRDNADHNVFSPAAAASNWVGFDLGRYNFDKKGRKRLFRETGEFDIYCDIHKCMTAKVKVVSTRYHARVVDGVYTLTGVPPGTYRVAAWAPNSKDSWSQPIRVTPGGTVTVEELKVQWVAGPGSHTRVDGSPYPAYTGSRGCP